MSWKSRSTVVNRLTKPPLNDHSRCNLERSDANFSGVYAMENSPYNVKDDKVLRCQGTVVVVAGSSFGWEPVILSSLTGGGHDTLARSLNREEGGFVALRVTLMLMSKQ